MICFKRFPKEEAKTILPILFPILYENMNKIAPTGNTYDEDFKLWFDAISSKIQNEDRQIILIYDDLKIVGYFQYSINNETFKMEEIQFKKAYQGTGLFRQLYEYLFTIVPPEIKYVEAYAHKSNQKSQSILKYLGLQVIDDNKNSYHFCGNCQEVLQKYAIQKNYKFVKVRQYKKFLLLLQTLNNYLIFYL